jgi:hypothetical protein
VPRGEKSDAARLPHVPHSYSLYRSIYRSIYRSLYRSLYRRRKTAACASLIHNTHKRRRREHMDTLIRGGVENTARLPHVPHSYTTHTHTNTHAQEMAAGGLGVSPFSRSPSVPPHAC